MNKVIGTNVLLASTLGMLTSTHAIAQSVLYAQPYNESFYYQDTTTTTSVFDDFSLAGGASIDQVDWSGVDISGVSGFVISFWSDNSGMPGTMLASDNIVGLAGQTFTESFINGEIIWDYSAPLTTSFSAAPGTEYFLSIVANSVAIWGWETSGVGNSGAVAYTPIFLDPYYGLNANLAFTLEGTTVAEPSTIMLCLLGGLGFPFWRVIGKR